MTHLVKDAHDDGVDITLVLKQPLTPTTSSLLNLVATDTLNESKYEIGGNGFHTGVFLSGSISPIISSVPIPASLWLFSSGLLGLVGMARCKKTA